MRCLLATAGLAATLASVVEAHTSFTTLFINDINQGDGTCVRQPKNPQTSTNPVEDLSSTDMACGQYFFLSLSLSSIESVWSSLSVLPF